MSAGAIPLPSPLHASVVVSFTPQILLCDQPSLAVGSLFRDRDRASVSATVLNYPILQLLLSIQPAASAPSPNPSPSPSPSHYLMIGKLPAVNSGGRFDQLPHDH